MSNMIKLQLAAFPVRNAIPKDATLSDRVKFAMHYVRQHARTLFWMSYETTDDMMFRTAIAAVMLAGDESDKDIITRSMKPLKMLSAAASGIPVDFSAMPTDEDMLPLMKLWHDSESTTS